MSIKQSYSWRDYWPLIAIAISGLGIALYGWFLTKDIMRVMSLFMGVVLLLLSSLKLSNLREFAMSFAKYDLLAGVSQIYAKAYPFIEFLLGVGFLFSFWLVGTSLLTFVVMTIGAVGVWRNMFNDEVIMCACLGAVFNVPMTWVTLVEDLLMAGMSAVMFVLLI